MENLRYRIEFNEKALKNLLDLDKSARLLIKTAIEERIATEPYKYGKPLQYSWMGHRRIRVSKYRAIYRIDEIKKLVVIVVIDHREQVY